MHIDWIPDDFTQYSGRLGITHMPGYERALEEDLAGLAQAGVQQLVCLQQSFELQRAGGMESPEHYQEAVNAQGMGFQHTTIQDFSTPSQAPAQQLVTAIYQQLADSQRVVVHCFLGLGRAGTIAACVLVRDGFNAPAAIELVREYRPGAIQTHAQEQFIHTFAQVMDKDIENDAAFLSDTS